MRFIIFVLFTIISAYDIPIISGEEPNSTLIISLDNSTDVFYDTTETYNITNLFTLATTLPPCSSSSIFSFAYEFITNIINGNYNSTITESSSAPCSNSNNKNAVPSKYYIFPLIALINEWYRFYRL